MNRNRSTIAVAVVGTVLKLYIKPLICILREQGTYHHRIRK